MPTVRARLEVGSFAGKPALRAVLLSGEQAQTSYFLEGPSGASRACFRSGEIVFVTYSPADQFCREASPQSTAERKRYLDALAAFHAAGAALLEACPEGLAGGVHLPGYPSQWGSFDEVVGDIAEWAHNAGVKS